MRAGDRSGNASGSVEYKISFEEVNRSTITPIFNYPSPFSTKTHFVFTLTGSKIPDHFRIRIMTITGKVVKDIRRDELGPIRIGRNMTEYYRDGRDEFGDLLANGVYLYHVTTSLNDQEIERRETAGDQFFTKGLRTPDRLVPGNRPGSPGRKKPFLFPLRRRTASPGLISRSAAVR